MTVHQIGATPVSCSVGGLEKKGGNQAIVSNVLGVSALPAPCRVVHSSHKICVEWRALPELTFIAGFSYTRLQPSSETMLVSVHSVFLLIYALSGYHILP